MGYTHYWYENNKPKLIPTEAVKVIKPILDQAYKKGLIQLEYDKPEPPIVSDKEIRFNGVGENGHETFLYQADQPESDRSDWSEDKRFFGFCKTAQKPYDEVVMKVLMILDAYMPEMALSSDGDFMDDWNKAYKSLQKKMRLTVDEKIKFRIY